MVESGYEINAIFWFVIGVIALFPSIILLVTYLRVKSKRLLLASSAFFLFVLKGIILSMKLFLDNYQDGIWWSVAAVLDLVIIALISFALMRKAEKT